MRIAVTVREAFSELTVQHLVMRKAVAFLAARDGRMQPFMAVDTIHTAMKCSGSSEIPALLAVTDLAV